MIYGAAAHDLCATAPLLFVDIFYANRLPPKRGTKSNCGLANMKFKPTPAGLEDLQSMTKEELIDALVMARITEARLKKGYLVEGVGAEKKFIPIGKKSTK